MIIINNKLILPILPCLNLLLDYNNLLLDYNNLLPDYNNHIIIYYYYNPQIKRTKDSYLLTFSTHCENKPFEVCAEPRLLLAKCTTSNRSKTSLPGAIAILKTLGSEGP